MFKGIEIKNESNHLLEGFAGSPLAPYLNADPTLDTGRPLDDLVWEQAEKTPQATAVISGSTTVTFAELRYRAERVAAGLLDRERQSGDRILVHLDSGVAFIENVLGILLAGCVPVLTLPGHGLVELRHLAQLSGAVELVSNDGALIAAVAQEVSTEPHVFTHSLPLGEPAGYQWHPQFQPDNPALLLVSGGTTGLPKLIARTHHDYRYNVVTAVKACQVSSNDVYLVALPLAHNFPLGCPGVLGTLAVGGTVVCAPSPSPDVVLELIEEHQVTMVASVPSLGLLWAEATDWENRTLDSLRLIQIGGARLSVEQAQYVDEKFGGKLQQVFGMAEGLLCFTRPADPDRHRVHNTQGYPMSAMDQLRIGTDGGLEVQGPYTIRGYYRAPEANAVSFTSDGWYRSGDRVSIHSDGAVVVQGRIKDVVIKAGENIDCVELEEFLMTVDGVQAVIVTGMPDEFLGEAIVAAVVPEWGAEISLPQLRSAVLAAGLADFKQPDRLLLLDRLPLTVMGKPDRKAVVAQVLGTD